MATVYLKSHTGRSLLRERAPADPGPFLPGPETLEKAAREFQRLGFTIEGRGATLSISGPAELFEQTCGVQITETPGEGWKSSQPVMHIAGLEDLVDGIVVAVRGIPF